MLLPNNLGCLADFCDQDWEKDDRYSVGGVQLKLIGDKFEATATDTRMAVLVHGNSIQPADPKSDFAKFAEQNGDKDACAAGVIIPHGVWSEAFRRESNVAVQLETKQATLTSNRYDSQLTLTAIPPEGRFPAVRDIIPTDEPKVKVRVDPRRMIECLQAAQRFLGADVYGVDIEFRETGSMLVIRCKNPELEQTATILLMPISED